MARQWQWHGVAVLVGVVAGALLLWMVIPRDAKKTKVEMKFGDNKLTLDVDKDLSDPKALIQKLLKEDYSRAGMLGLLGKQRIFSIEDPAMIGALQDLCPDKKPAGETVVQRQKRLQSCLDKNALKQLRQLAEQHTAPFQYIGTEVNIGTPQDSQPQDGRANVCVNGGLLGHRIQISSLQGTKTITVEATGFFICTGLPGVPDIQLSANDALKLFGRPTRKLEKAVAVVL